MSDLTTPSPEAGGRPVDEALAQELVERARSELVGPGGLLTGLAKTVLETALEAELEDHLGYAKHAPEGRDKGNSPNGTRSKTVLTEVGEVEIEVPRDRDGSFDPKIVRKRQRRLAGVDELVISLAAKGLTTVLGRDDLFLNSVGDLELLPRVLDAAARFEYRPSAAEMDELVERKRMSSMFV